MSIFDKLVLREYGGDSTLGNPLRDPIRIAARKSIMAAYTGGKGFRVPKKAPRVHPDGLTRGERRRAAREKFLASFA